MMFIIFLVPQHASRHIHNVQEMGVERGDKLTGTNQVKVVF